jgi:hypothetical protein
MTDLHLWLPNSHVRMPYVRSLGQVRIYLSHNGVFTDLIHYPYIVLILRRQIYFEKTHCRVDRQQVLL